MIASRTRHALLGQLPRHLTSRRTPCSDPAQDAPLPIEAQGLWRAGRLVLSAAKPRKEGVNGKEGGSRSGGEFCLLVFYRPPFVAFLARRSTELSFETRWHGLAGWFVLTAPLCLPRKMGRWGRAVWAPARPQWAPPGAPRRAGQPSPRRGHRDLSCRCPVAHSQPLAGASLHPSSPSRGTLRIPSGEAARCTIVWLLRESWSWMRVAGMRRER